MTLPPTIRVLLTEDVPSDAELELRELRRAGLRVSHRIVDDEKSFERAVREFAPDIILSDFSMPHFDGMAALALARDLCPEVPFIFVSGTIGEEYAIRALKAGATDYVLKTNLLRLPAAVERALAEAKEKRDRRRTEIELDIARERLTSIFNSLPDVLWSVDAHSDRILYMSPAAQEVYGHAADDFLQHPMLWLEVVHPDDRRRVMDAWERARKGEPFDIEYRTARPDGTVRWINDRGRMIRNEDGTPARIDGLARDITEQVEHRARIARLSRIRELLGEVNSLIVRIRERQALFQEFCRIAVSRGGFVLARIVEVAEDGRARIAASTESGTSLFHGMIEAYNRDPAGAESLFAHALRSGEVVVSNNVGSDPRVRNRDALTREGNYSLALLPVKVDSRLAGLVALRAREAGYFDQEEMRLLEEMVSNIAFALELMAKQERISYLALYDPLTDLPNRALFHERLSKALAEAREANDPVALVLIDLERFKAINDTLGQQAGDFVLQQVAWRLKEFAGDANRVARLGANVFALFFQRIGGAEEVARRIEAGARRLFGAPLQVAGREVRIAAKAGIGVSPDDGADADTLVRNAEAALKRAKETGERYLFYAPSLNARVSEQLELEGRLRKAVDQGELFLHFQPKYDLATRRIVGLEALMRWRGPDGQLVSPARFVPVLEETGLILEAGKQVLSQAKAVYARWRQRGIQAPRIAVNVSAAQLRRKTFVADVREALGDVGDDGGGVDLELTESLLMTDVDESIRKLRELRAMGLRMGLDDFGTGYSSLAYLSKLPLDALKIDRSFVLGMSENPDHTSIVSAVISLAQALRLKVVAEGVETEEQAQLLRLLRCDQAQGFLFSRPLPVEEVERLL